ncbi:MAG TPA: Smr/MutS family protein [Rhizomicrobium sp.]|jgi:DNA-nicking Smr family endonuclease|nr:Smr/MutS family protein [Rhizomicrobium sp.]HEX4533668.1 Smr/MutS family protein [Rhizomicrobium sp.]
MKRRTVSEEERALFEDTFKGTRKVAPKKVAKPAAAPVKAKPQKPQAPTVNGRTDRLMRRGDLEPEARLDLHGLTEAAAYRAVLSFVRTAYVRGHRLVIIVTGKGKPIAHDAPFDLELLGRSRGVLRTMTPRWLAEPDLAKFIATTRSAHRRHGGEGALYVYLRKPRR